mmetsp:Transcript_16846/g.36530  ORF Transcript_16846/g.36530 Transcript_16846/m.36530 type:complete len:371 (+) Transcript_16846:41-1153(+)
MIKFHHTLLFLLVRSTQSRNIAITSDGIALATEARGSQRLITYDALDNQETAHSFGSSLPNNVNRFDDVAVDPNSRARDSTIAFAIDANSGIVCSFNLRERNNSRGVSLDHIGCTTQGVNTSPFVGIAAMGGTVVVSGGTGGASVFTYDEDSGVLSDRATIRNRSLGDIGYPDVTLVTPEIAAFSADVEQGFGVVVSSINTDSKSLTRDRVFLTEDSVEFNFIILPANFPLTSSMYFQEGSGKNYLYVANGGITVQDPQTNGRPRVVDVAPIGFKALTVDVNSERAVAVFGGVITRSRRTSSVYIVLDISDPLDPELVNTEVVSRRSRGGRITGVASAGQSILYVTENSASIGHASLQTIDKSDKIVSFA